MATKEEQRAKQVEKRVKLFETALAAITIMLEDEAVDAALLVLGREPKQQDEFASTTPAECCEAYQRLRLIHNVLNEQRNQLLSERSLAVEAAAKKAKP